MCLEVTQCQWDLNQNLPRASPPATPAAVAEGLPSTSWHTPDSTGQLWGLVEGVAGGWVPGHQGLVLGWQGPFPPKIH